MCMLLDGHKNYIMKANCFFLLILLFCSQSRLLPKEMSVLLGSPLTTHLGCVHFSVQLKHQVLEKEVQLISSPFDLPDNKKSTSRGIFAQQKEKQNSEMCIPFACFLNKIKNKFRHAYHGCLVKLVHACLTAKKVR